ncbi:hsp90 co-chaperone Cdc37 [Microsporum canis]|uniref:Hsp90 chaperone protein kinase-targeting subunit n=1 Tax=Arthroderma otae (strain ATCC MYA-4605 / CBS 113480) TaxID=554155 RepID=C5FRA4_ARTOC|nr:hsp90-like protein [Microsporum canis CBS 113480]EEQ32407.1 hsp90-like protein [Microsporum canis CBS 113480]
MVLDYSKWDALELSDDSDIEVHPNVDKRSFIRAKQNQIHQQRQQRRHEIATLGYERIINDGLLKRIDSLLTALKKHESDSRNPDELVFQALIESAGDPKEDQPPAPPENVHTQGTQPKYSQMMGSLVDQVKKELDESRPENRYQAFITGVEGHKTKVLDLQQQLLEKLAQLEKEESKKITSDSIHTGFDSSFVSSSKSKSEPKKPKEATVELLNPGCADNMDAVSSGAEADVEDGEGGGEEEEEEGSITVRPLTKEFAKHKIGDYREAYSFLTDHPELLAEKRTDELLMEAFNAQMAGDEEYARQCVHHGLLLQYCRSLGKDGVALFFKRITTEDHRAGVMFRDDVNDTYNRIKTRVKELAKSSNEGPSEVEQIQLHAVDPSTQLNISIPPADSKEEAHIAAREIFNSFPPGLQKALESESLDEVNKVLGKMSVEEAEGVVEKLGESGILTVEQGIVDATTEEGKQWLQELEAEGKGGAKAPEASKEEIGDPE